MQAMRGVCVWGSRYWGFCRRCREEEKEEKEEGDGELKMQAAEHPVDDGKIQVVTMEATLSCSEAHECRELTGQVTGAGVRNICQRREIQGPAHHLKGSHTPLFALSTMKGQTVITCEIKPTVVTTSRIWGLFSCSWKGSNHG